MDPTPGRRPRAGTTRTGKPRTPPSLPDRTACDLCLAQPPCFFCKEFLAPLRRVPTQAEAIDSNWVPCCVRLSCRVQPNPGPCEHTRSYYTLTSTCTVQLKSTKCTQHLQIVPLFLCVDGFTYPAVVVFQRPGRYLYETRSSECRCDSGHSLSLQPSTVEYHGRNVAWMRSLHRDPQVLRQGGPCSSAAFCDL